MATLNSELQPERMTISDVSAKLQANDIYIDDSYQRRSVWVKKNKVSLIETILMGYPMPEIYLWESEPDPATGKTRLSVVDGQQRLRTISEFIANEFPLTRSNLSKENKSSSFANKMFDQLEDSERSSLWNYRLNVRILPHYLSKDEIIAIFLRLNETDKSLNPQELRNAKFNGKFIQAAIDIADFPFWEKYGLFSPAKIRRMNDVLFTSQFLAFLRRGIDGDISARAINELYDAFNNEYRQRQSDVAAAKLTTELMGKIFETSEDLPKFFRTQAHLYSLLISSYILIERNTALRVPELSLRLQDFINVYNDSNSSHDRIEEYRKASLEGLSSKSSRETRVKIMLAVLDGSFIY